MEVYPINDKYTIIISENQSFFYSRPLESLFVHIPGDYPTFKVTDRKYRLPKFDEVIEDKSRPIKTYYPSIYEIGAIFHGKYYPPNIFPFEEDENNIIGMLRFPLEHRVCDNYADVLKVEFGSVSVFTDPETKEFVLSFSPDGAGEESLFSMLYYSLNRKTIFDEIVELALRVLEWSNPMAYTKELDEAYRKTITERLRKITPTLKPLDYTPIYFISDKIYVETPSAVEKVDKNKIRSFLAFMSLV